MCLHEDVGCWSLMDFPNLNTRAAVFHEVELAHSMSCTNVIESPHQLQGRHALAIQCHRFARDEVYVYYGRIWLSQSVRAHP